MRVISGARRGKRLKELPGLETRPTTDRVKESIFNIIQFDIPGRNVLDLFAGTGQMGIEAISRGATRATFVDLRRDAVAVIGENLTATGFAPAATVVQEDALNFLRACRQKFDVIFLDPPYSSNLLENALKSITDIDIVSENGIIICEHSLDYRLPELPHPYLWGKAYRYGKIQVTLCRRMAEQ
ncbi:MAG: 16S rRNA (guanine(966)-N(2))-methyltransferase RsmD [Oscillospiraceae bacterium]|nr:16S rRNA (guanine(966)-N(2))-methyltransferase RsmD [Oscillospiraceae bacterium]